MAALVVTLSPFVAPLWLWIACLSALALVPMAEWIRRSPQRVRFTVAFAIAVTLGTVGLWADVYPPGGVWDNCCQWLVPYGICWPIEWC